MFIDNRGRIFGKVNILDLLIVLVVIGAVAGVYLKGRTSSIGPAVKTSSIVMELKSISDVAFDPVDTIAIGENIRDDKGVVLGKVTQVDVLPRRDYVAASTGEWILAEKAGLVEIRVKLLGTGVATGDSIKISGNEYGAGHTMVVRGNRSKFFAYVLDIKEQ